MTRRGEIAQREADRRFWKNVAINAACMLAFTGGLIACGVMIIDHLG